MPLNQRSIMLTLMLGTLVLSPLAEAKRMGGGKSYGTSRSAPANNYQNRNTTPTPQQTHTQQNSSGVGKMVMAGVAGAAVGAVAVNAMANNDPTTSTDAASAQEPVNMTTTTEESSSFSWLWLLVLAMGALFAFRYFSNKKSAVQGNPFSPNHAGKSTTAPSFTRQQHGTDNTNIFGQTVGQSGGSAVFTDNGNQLPDGTQPAAFLRQARAKFLHLQTMNSSSNIEEVRRYFTPEMYLAIRDDILANDDLAEFPQLNAQLADSAHENGQFIASVRFSGMVSESLNAEAVPFTETWHFVKNGTAAEWLVAGIQQS